ncbi:MAG: toxin-antitoxin system YwqK family antitoxin [Bacteroidales bacterium]|nr:toxin-antitoxin system YwqK family antitoxin [Bacteroidales bacterium]
MKQKLLLFVCFLLFSNLLSAQDMNRTDAKGRRQGPWVDFYANGQKRYEGQFKNDQCVGEFRYYDEQGKLKATNSFDKGGTRALNKSFNNGVLVATGYYIDKKKEGEWRYYSKDNGKLILVEENKDGKVNGNSTVYNPQTGKVAEEAVYVDGRRNGPSKQYYDSGVLMMECQYKDHLLDGPAKTYYPSGALKEEGSFLRGNKTGIWKTYNEDGDEVSRDQYSAPAQELMDNL